MPTRRRLVRVLVVDDDEAVRGALTHALHRDGYEVSTAGDGATALATPLRLRHDAVVLDVLMPEPGGLEVCRVIRARGDDTPILMLTARDLVSGQRRSRPRPRSAGSVLSVPGRTVGM